jgi:hypothetical protein
VVARPENISENLIWVIPAEGIRLAKAPGPVLGAFAFRRLNHFYAPVAAIKEKIVPQPQQEFLHTVSSEKRY